MRSKILIASTCCAMLLAGALSSCQSSKSATDKAATMALNFALVENKTFLFKGKSLNILGRTLHNINPATNFVSVDGDKGIVQVSPGIGGGPNGVGGFTVEGSITKFKVTKKTDTQYSVSFNLNAPVGSCEVFISVYGDHTSARIVNTMRGMSVDYTGEIAPPGSYIHEGSTRF